uniref:Uncharacterized protein n=1 Tax=Lepeophtheirus salmonis TaxID=72036 RepID=A0A0K2TZI0_LEPSM
MIVVKRLRTKTMG